MTDEPNITLEWCLLLEFFSDQRSPRLLISPLGLGRVLFGSTLLPTGKPNFFRLIFPLVNIIQHNVIFIHKQYNIHRYFISDLYLAVRCCKLSCSWMLYRVRLATFFICYYTSSTPVYKVFQNILDLDNNNKIG